MPLTIHPVNIEDLDLRPAAEGITNKDGSPAHPLSRLLGSVRLGPWCMHVECYEVEQVPDGAGYIARARDDAWEEEVERIFACLGEGHPSCWEIDGRCYMMIAFPYSE